MALIRINSCNRVAVSQFKVAAEKILRVFYEEILPNLPVSIRNTLGKLSPVVIETLEEIRLREGKPLLIGLGKGDSFVTSYGSLTLDPEEAYKVTPDDTAKTAQLMSEASIYAFEDEIKNGFITLRGGHRVGITGKVIPDGGKIKTLKYFSGFNIRLAREIKGVADKVLPYLINPGTGEFYHTLIISPPRCGKTTLLRDIIRQVSNGIPELSFSGVTVGVVDERSEIAGCFRGVPQKDVGVRTDVLDSCPKAEGMMMLVRAMAPNIIATDEIGRPEDVKALEEVLNAGIKVLTTVHGSSHRELLKRPALKSLLEIKIFERLVILGRSKGVGTVEDILEGDFFNSLLKPLK